MDYESKIDAETWAFIRRTEAHYPPDTATYPVERQRAIYDEMCRAFFEGYPEGVAVSDTEIGGVRCRLYEAGETDVTVVYLHGGGFVVGGLDSHDDVCAEICARTGYRVVSVDYRLYPEHPLAAPFQDTFAAVQAVAVRWGGTLLLAGDSAGGMLAASASQISRGGGPEISGQVLIYPGLDGDISKGSYIEHANAPMLTRDEVLFYRSTRAGVRAEHADDLALSPLSSRDFAGLPPTVIVTAECDPVRDDGRDYRDRIVAAGGKAVWIDEPGLVHGYLRARSTVTRARQSFDRIITAIAVLGRREWPY